MQHFFSTLNLNKKFLTFDGYFPNKANECGICSLANLIYLKYGDINTAIKIYFNSRKHPLVSFDGTTDISSFPVILEDLSKGKYSGRCYLNPSLSYDIENFKLNSILKEKIREAFNLSLDRKLIIIERNYSVNYPHILFLMSSDPDVSAHALVHKNPSTFINNGYLEYFLPKNFDIEGVFDVFKK
ncbi:MAG TPA: hypothetical protein PK357_03575 [Candidatus Pacearchaeota archaeon]|nr:hypothetical protein [Candidatus Pacearchaeota archaeon]